MERKLTLLLALFAALSIVSALTVTAPLTGLTTIMGVSVLGSSVLGSSVLGSSVMGSTVLGSSVMSTTTVVAAYSEAVGLMQPLLSVVLIGLLVYLEFTDSVYGRMRAVFVELRRSWLPVSALLTIVFSVNVALKVWSILMG